MVVYLFPSSVHPRIIANQKNRLKRVKKEIDFVITDSSTTKEDIIKFLQIPQDKINIVLLAASEQFTPSEENKINSVLEKYKIKKPYILSVATQEPRKNIQKLLDVFELIHKKRPELQLVLAGRYGRGPGLHINDNARLEDKSVTL